MSRESELDAWWRSQIEDIKIDRALTGLHWHRVNAPDHVCDVSRCGECGGQLTNHECDDCGTLHNVGQP